MRQTAQKIAQNGFLKLGLGGFFYSGLKKGLKVCCSFQAYLRKTFISQPPDKISKI